MMRWREMRRLGYATKPVFHWRLPTLLWTFGKLPSPEIARWFLVVLTGVMIMVWVNRLRPRLGFVMMLVAALLMAPMLFLASHPRWYFQHEVWAGVLVALSLGLYRQHWVLAVITGVAALMVRELALSYVCIIGALAFYDRRNKEGLAWLAGIMGFAVYFAVHASIAISHQLPSDLSDPSWLRIPGWSHVTACSGWMFLTLVPYWLCGMLSVVGVFGLLVGRDLRLILPAVSYMAAFWIFGKPFNDYWGLMYTPILAVGIACAIPAIVALARRAAAKLSFKV